MEGTIGEIRMFGGNFAPRSWALCDGQLLSINQNQALFSILGTTYGGDGRTTFGLPDMRGRVSMGEGHGPGLTNRRLGAKGGSEENTIGVNQMPAHGHSVPLSAPIAHGTYDGDINSSLADTGFVKATFADPVQNQTLTMTAQNTGGGQAVNNVQPFQCVNYIICLQGIFPSRN